MSTTTQQTQLTAAQLRDELAMDIATNLRLRGYKLDDDAIMIICAAAYDLAKQVAK